MFHPRQARNRARPPRSAGTRALMWINRARRWDSLPRSHWMSSAISRHSRKSMRSGNFKGRKREKPTGKRSGSDAIRPRRRLKTRPGTSSISGSSTRTSISRRAAPDGRPTWAASISYMGRPTRSFAIRLTSIAPPRRSGTTTGTDGRLCSWIVMDLSDMSLLPPAAPSFADSRLRWVQFLATQKLRSTAPRQQTLESILNAPRHFDAEALRLRLRGQGKRLSRASTYRTLSLLVTAGVLHRTQLVDGTLHYELAKPSDPHHHLVCRRCGAIQEVLDESLARALANLVRRSTFAAEEVAVRVRGLCSKCRDS